MTFLTISLVGQDSLSSVITNVNYINDPSLYLSKINNSVISSEILIDRSNYDNIVFNVNGYDKVTTVSASEWFNIYSDLNSSSINSLIVPDLEVVNDAMDLIYKSNKAFPIGILDITFNKIKKSALENGELIEDPDFLFDNGATDQSYSEHRAVAVSCLNHNMSGDEINFYLGDFFNFTNNKTQNLDDIEIDFDDGGGYRKVNFNEVTSVRYSSRSGFLNIKVKLHFSNKVTGEKEVLYANSSVFRTGSATVPETDRSPVEKRAMGIGNASYYPAPVYIDTKVCRPCGNSFCCIEKSVLSIHHSLIEYHVLYSDENKEKDKLRRPLIICDGFDPGDRRSFDQYRFGPGSLLQKEKDYRGLRQLLNGDPSPWYSNKPSAKLIDRLNQDGYDIVIVNFLDGAGDIRKNAGVNGLRGFFNDVINGPDFRDHKTEEITLIGPSMGGLITRHSLTNMEKNDEEHFVKNWISFDAPQKGANIPLGLQYAINFLSKIKTGGVPVFKKAKASFVAGKESLNSVAAKQLLKQHYSTNSYMGNPTSDYVSLYSELSNLGYPEISRNFAISNGGNGNLYSDAGSEILDFKTSGWTYVEAHGNRNNDGLYTVFEGSRLGLSNDETKKTHSEIGYENSPGGWNSSLYSLNCHSKNWHQKSDNNTPYTKSTFMTTASAFGIDVDRGSVYKTHDDFTNCNINVSGKVKSPFDEIHGMNDNEEHVRISVETADYLIDYVLREDFNESKRPRRRDGKKAVQNVKGDVAFTAKENYIFAGDGSEFSIHSNADVIMTTGNSIKFSPGFSILKGGKLAASIKAVDYKTVFRRQEIKEVIDYTKPSPYTNEVADYSSSNRKIEKETSLNISPNPFSNHLRIEIDDVVEGNEVLIALYAGSGEKVHSGSVNKNGTVVIETSHLAPGIYICVVKSLHDIKTKKILKL
jgi:hypothetical protein